MDKERARFVLQSFRPEGADAADADFAEALRLATSDRELGQWLVRERAFDADFAEALARVELPKGLREDVLLAMVQDDRDVVGPEAEEDAKMIVAMASIRSSCESAGASHGGDGAERCEAGACSASLKDLRFRWLLWRGSHWHFS